MMERMRRDGGPKRRIFLPGRWFGSVTGPAFCIAIFIGVQFAPEVRAQEVGATARVWALGYFWRIEDVDWIEFRGKYDLRAVAALIGPDVRSEQPDSLSASETLGGLCATLLAHRLFAPSDALGRGDIFRISLNLRDPNDPDEFVFERVPSLSVVDGECSDISPEGSFPLSYQAPLDGWQFSGFAVPDSIDVLANWEIEAVPVFVAPEDFEPPFPLDLLCDAAVFEARYWRRLGSLRQGAQIAIAVQTGEMTTFFQARWSLQGCQYLARGD